MFTFIINKIIQLFINKETQTNDSLPLYIVYKNEPLKKIVVNS